jgi:hypothetical protein
LQFHTFGPGQVHHALHGHDDTSVLNVTGH